MTVPASVARIATLQGSSSPMLRSTVSALCASGGLHAPSTT